MARVNFTGLAGNISDINAMFTQLYLLRELISDPGYVAATPKLTIDGSGNFTWTTNLAAVNGAFSGTFAVTGASAFTGAATFGGALTVTGGNITTTSTRSILVTGSGGLGYGTGSGGTVTQATSKSTAVTLDKSTGQITMNAAALAANTTVQFVLNSTAIAATDTVVLTQNESVSGLSYNIWPAVGAGYCRIQVRNITGGSLSEAIVINFAVIKAVTS